MSTTLLFLAASLCLQTTEAPDRTKPARPASATTDRTHLDFQFNWAGMTNHRQQLRKGIVSMTGRLVDDNPTVVKLDGPTRILCAFDLDAQKFRFDRTEPYVVDTTAVAESKPKPGTKVPPPQSAARTAGAARYAQKIGGGQFVRVPGKSFYHVNGEATVSTVQENEAPLYEARTFDLRGIGLYHWLDLQETVDLDKVLASWTSVEPDQVVADDQGVVRMRWTFAQGMAQRTFWLDTKKGFTPARFEVRWKDDKSPSGWSDPRVVSQSTWEERSGAWVPTTYRIEDHHGSDRTRIYELAFDWKSVNEPVSDEYFTMEGLKLTSGTLLVDTRLSKPILVGKIGEDHAPLIDSLNSEQTPVAARKRWTIVAVLNTAILLVVAVVVVCRQLKARAAEESGKP